MGIVAYAVDAVSHCVEPMLRYISYGCEAMACGVDKLKRELVHVFSAPAAMATGVGCGLTAESNGFRQSSAADIGAEERTALAC